MSRAGVVHLNTPGRGCSRRHAPVPFSPVLEDAYVPTPEAVVAAARSLLA